MGALLVLLFFALILLLLSEPLYITVRKSRGTRIVFHFVFFSIMLVTGKNEDRHLPKKEKKKKISPTTYLKVWLKLRKRVKIKIDAIYLPLNLSAYTEALLSGLYPPLRRGIYLFDKDSNTSLLLHVETTLLDALLFYHKCKRFEKIKNEG